MLSHPRERFLDRLKAASGESSAPRLGRTHGRPRHSRSSAQVCTDSRAKKNTATVDVSLNGQSPPSLRVILMLSEAALASVHVGTEVSLALRFKMTLTSLFLTTDDSS